MEKYHVIWLIVAAIAAIFFIVIKPRLKKKDNSSTSASSHNHLDEQTLNRKNNYVKPLQQSPSSFLDFLPDYFRAKHNEVEQLARQNRAQELLCDPTSYRYSQQSAEFDSEKHDVKYYATLYGCSCYDYQHRGLPCKHMYALAMLVFQEKTNTIIDHTTPLYDVATVSTHILSLKNLQNRKINRFIAFDTETTGFSFTQDRIVELGAVIFENGQIVGRYSSLVNPGIVIPPVATAVNHITQAMVATAPSESVVYPDFLKFIGDAITGQTILCAHNAQFDKRFLADTLKRLGFSANLVFVDTLTLSKQLIPGLENYKLQTVAEYFGLTNFEAHRATSDAEICGQIFLQILPFIPQQMPRSKGPQINERIATNRRAIYQLDDNNNVIMQFESISEAVEKTGINSKSIRDAASGKQKHAGGYVWRYVEDKNPIAVK